MKHWPPGVLFRPELDWMLLPVARSWDGTPARDDEIVKVGLTFESEAKHLLVDVVAPFHGDPPPPGPPGSTPRLWEHEVVELMLLGDDQRYLEIELAPGGHYLVLELHGARNILREGMALTSYEATIDREARSWRGRARVPIRWLPEGLGRVNAFAIHGAGEARRYLCWRAPGGEQPDFHQLEAFGSLDDLMVVSGAWR
ncbi:MAG: hypothetical protein KC503_18385 [Myxococcales bacterium]|nr:hypothetical protein [Myxococcales bacterium]